MARTRRDIFKTSIGAYLRSKNFVKEIHRLPDGTSEVGASRYHANSRGRVQIEIIPAQSWSFSRLGYAPSWVFNYYDSNGKRVETITRPTASGLKKFIVDYIGR